MSDEKFEGHLFFQFVKDPETAERHEIVGVVSGERFATRDEVIAAIDAEDAVGEWVEWDDDITYHGEKRVNYFAGFCRPVPKVEPKRTNKAQRTKRARKVAEVVDVQPKVQRVPLEQLRMEM